MAAVAAPMVMAVAARGARTRRAAAGGAGVVPPVHWARAPGAGIGMGLGAGGPSPVQGWGVGGARQRAGLRRGGGAMHLGGRGEARGAGVITRITRFRDTLGADGKAPSGSKRQRFASYSRRVLDAWRVGAYTRPLLSST